MEISDRGARRAWRDGALFALSSVLALSIWSIEGTSALAVVIDQDALITQTDANFVYFEAEWFDRVTVPDPNPPWELNFNPPAGSSGGKTIRAPGAANDTLGNNNNFAIYQIDFSTAGTYRFYANRVGGAGDSMLAPPDFNADPFQAPLFQGVNNDNNRWNTLVDNAWNEFGVDGDFPAVGYFASGIVGSYTVAAPGVHEFRIEAREANAQYDRFLLHQTTGLAGGTIDALAFSNAVVNNPATPPPPPPFLNIGPEGNIGTWGVREVRNLGTISGVAGAVAALQNDQNTNAGTRFEAQRPLVNYSDPENAGGEGYFGSASRLPFLSNDLNGAATDDDDIALIANGYVLITQEDDYTFGFRGDDASRMKVDGAAFTSVFGGGFANGDTLEFSADTGDSNTYGVTHLTPGIHRVEVVWNERAGGAFLEVFAAQNSTNTADFRLIGDTANGGLELVSVIPEPSSFLLIAIGAVGVAAIFRVRRGRR